MAVNKVVKSDGTALIDITGTTAVATDVAKGKIFYSASGEETVGTLSSRSIYYGSSAPSSSFGEDGDLYFVTQAGATIERYPAEVTSSKISSYGTSYLKNCIGVSAENGESDNNVYSSSSNTSGTASYTFDLSDIPSDAVINSVACAVMAHEENSSKSECHLQLYSGNTAKGSKTTVSGTSNEIYNLTCGSWTRSELNQLALVLSVGYYGGLIAGATLTVSYQTDEIYSASITGGQSGWNLESASMYKKANGSWTQTSSVSLTGLLNILTG